MAVALGVLADEGKLNWDEKVVKYLPGFRLYDALANREITIRELLCHRSGLGTGVGDLMHDPDSNNITVADIIHKLRHLNQIIASEAGLSLTTTSTWSLAW